MNTSRPVRKCRKSESGVTVVEIAIVMLIMGLLALLVATPLQMTNQLSRTTLDRVVESIDTNLSIRLLTQHISNSQLVRSSAFQCTGLSAVFSKPVLSVNPDSDTIVLLPNQDKRFSLPYISASSIGSVDPSRGDSVFVTDPTLYGEGDIVAVISADNTDKAGLFEVIDRNIATSSLRLRDTDINDEDNDCRLTAGRGMNLAQFKDLGTSGEKTLLIQKFHVAIYKVVNNDITLRVFPQSGSSADVGTRVFSNFESMTLKPMWQPREVSGSGPTKLVDGEIAGTFWTIANVVLLEKEIDQTRNQLDCQPGENRVLSASFKCADGILNRIRRFNTYGRYVMSASNRLNIGVQTNAIPKKNLFPTCLVVKSDAGIAVHVPADLADTFVMDGDRRLVYVTGAVSEPGLGQASMSVEVIGQGTGGSAVCIHRRDLEGYDTYDTAGKTEILDKNRLKQTSSFTIKGTALKMDEYACSVQGSVIFKGRLSYYDPSIGANGVTNCSDAQMSSITVASKFDFEGSAVPTCKSHGAECPVPPIVDTVTKKPPPGARFFRGKTCTWSDGNTSRPCCEGVPASDPKVTLIGVKYHTGLMMANPSKLDVRCSN